MRTLSPSLPLSPLVPSRTNLENVPCRRGGHLDRAEAGKRAGLFDDIDLRVPAHQKRREVDDRSDGEASAREEVLDDGDTADEEGNVALSRCFGRVFDGSHEEFWRRRGKKGVESELLRIHCDPRDDVVSSSPPINDRLTLSIVRELWFSTPREIGKDEGSMEVPSTKGKTVLGTTRLRVA